MDTSLYFIQFTCCNSELFKVVLALAFVKGLVLCWVFKIFIYNNLLKLELQDKWVPFLFNELLFYLKEEFLTDNNTSLIIT